LAVLASELLEAAALAGELAAAVTAEAADDDAAEGAAIAEEGEGRRNAARVRRQLPVTKGTKQQLSV
jgi:hypothetical protein